MYLGVGRAKYYYISNLSHANILNKKNSCISTKATFQVSIRVLYFLI